MRNFEARRIIDAVAAPNDLSPPNAGPRELSPEAMAVASEFVPASYPPIVVAGFARFVEFSLIVAIGFAIYAFYVLPRSSLGGQYPVAILAVASASVIAFQIAGIYRMKSFRSRAAQ